MGRGRPKLDKPADQIVKMRVTAEDKAAIRKRAERAGVTMSEYLLRCALPGKRSGS